VKEAKGDPRRRYGSDKTHYVNSKDGCHRHLPRTTATFHMLPASTLVGASRMSGVRPARTGYESSRMSKGEFFYFFFPQAIIIHGDRYCYDKVEVHGISEPVTITAVKHGDLPKSPSNHLSKTNPQGCPKCKVRASRKTTEKQCRSGLVLIHGRPDTRLQAL